VAAVCNTGYHEMNKVHPIHLLAALALAAAAATAPAQEQGVKRLVPGGDDGNTRSYIARCLDGTVGTVKLSHDTGRICVMAQGGKERCNPSWTLMEAGQRACGTAGSR